MNAETMAGIAQGIDQGVRNFINIKNAMSNERERKKNADIDFKIKEMQLKKWEDDASPEALALAREKLKLDKTTDRVVNMQRITMMRKARQEIQEGVLAQAEWLKRLQQPMAPGTAMSFGGLKIAGPKQKDEANEGLDFVNDLRGGGGSDNDLIEEYNTTKDKNRVRQIEDILTKKGYNFE